MRTIAGRSTRGCKFAIQPEDDTDDNGNGRHTRAHKTICILRCDAKAFTVLLSERSAMLGCEYVDIHCITRSTDKAIHVSGGYSDSLCSPADDGLDLCVVCSVKQMIAVSLSVEERQLADKEYVVFYSQ